MATIRGTAVANNLAGTNFNDRIYGRGGDDSIQGLGGDDYLSGNTGNDSLDGGIGDDELFGGTGNDTLIGGLGDDHLFGGSGLDNLSGGDGDDVLDGGSDTAADILNGGDGNDRIAARENDRVLGGADVDALSLTFSDTPAAPFTLDLRDISGNTATSVGVDGIRAGQFESANVFFFTFVGGTVVQGSGGDDTIGGSFSGAVSSDGIAVNGLGGNDTLGGTNKNDVLNGGVGDDHLTGGFGADRLTGGLGDDLFTAQLFNLSGSDPADTVADFRIADDAFLVSGQFSLPSGGVDEANPLNAGANPVATSGFGQFLYDTDNGQLFFDRDGTGAQTPFHIFTLTGRPVLTDNHFIIDVP